CPDARRTRASVPQPSRLSANDLPRLDAPVPESAPASGHCARWPCFAAPDAIADHSAGKKGRASASVTTDLRHRQRSQVQTATRLIACEAPAQLVAFSPINTLTIV